MFVTGSEQDSVLSALRLAHWPLCLWGIHIATELQLALGQTSGVPGALASQTGRPLAQLSHE